MASFKGPVFAKLTLLSLSLGFCIVFLEIGVRLLQPQSLSLWRTTRDGLVTMRPAIRGATSAQGRRVDTNRAGFRDVERVPGARKDGPRILVLGDSFMEALQVEKEDGLPSRLERELEALTGLPIEVATAAVSGWGTDDQLTWYRRDGDRWQADLVLVGVTLHNDVSDNLEERHHLYGTAGLEPRPNERIPWLEYQILRLKALLAGHSHLYRYLTGRTRNRDVAKRGAALDRHVVDLLREDAGARLDGGWRITEALLSELDQLARYRGAKLALFLIPLRVQLEQPRLAKLATRSGLEPDALDGERPQRRLVDWGAASGVPVIDLLARLKAYRAETGEFIYLSTDGHWNETGHRLAAEEVASRLVGLELLPAGVRTD